MADLIDEAQQREMDFTAAAIAKRRRPFVCEGTPEPRDCLDCGNPIPAQRLAACNGASRCIVCQGAIDRRLRQFAWGRR